MRLVTLLIILLGVCILYVVSNRVEHFFYNQNSITINWAAVSGATSYNWKVCTTATCDPNPDNWPSALQTSTTNSAILNNTTCINCDFGSSIQFAVQSVGSNTSLESAWTTITLDLQSYLRINQQRMVNSTTNPTPPKIGDTSSLYQIAFTGPIPMGIYEKNFAYVTLTRAGTTYNYNSPVLYTPSSNLSVASTTIDYTSANTNWNVPIPGGALLGGDVISVGSLFAQIGVNGPTWPPPNTNGPMYYFGSYQVTALAPPGAPGSLTWSVN